MKWGRERRENGERERENSAERNAVKKKSSFISAVSNNQGCIYSITKGIVYCIQRQRVECIINKTCMHNEVWGCAEIFPKSGTLLSFLFGRKISFIEISARTIHFP